ncbi:hypothetical protein ACQ7HM_00575 [Williamsia sp. MIQD14]|uniref:hypothetical protein n=1 Tax=Williamsia sp. MIQD14 TaxID=3425703 RepID=UPI003DA0B112
MSTDTSRPASEPVSRPTRDTVAALLDLDRAIRRASPTPVGLRILVGAFAVLLLVAMVGLTMATDAGAPRRTTAALCALVVIGALAIAPLIATRPSGVSPTDVRHLPVSANALRTASGRAMVRGPGLRFAIVALLLVPLAVATGPDLDVAAIVAAVVAIPPTAALGVIGSRVVGLTFAQAMRSQTGRLVATVSSVVAVAAIYVVYLLLSQGTIDPRNPVLQVVARVLPTGWPVVAGESITAGRWWLAVLVVAGLVLAAGGLYVTWSRRIDQAMYSDAVSAATGARRSENARRVTASPTLLVLRTEARMLVTDPQRLGLAILPLAFIVIGVVLMLSGTDAYGMQFGAPLVVFMCGSMLANTFGLDRWAFAVLITAPSAAALVIRARMTLAALLALAVGIVGTVVARTVRHTDPATWPVAMAVIVGGAATASSVAALLPALAPYRVPEGSSISSMNSRGSMSGNSVRWSLAAIPAMALVCAPGIALGLLLPTPLSYLAVAVEVVVAVPLTIWAHRRAVTLVAQRGPEILAAVTGTAPATADD